MFGNISFHKSASWTAEQTAATAAMGCKEVKDFGFPNVPAAATTAEVAEMTEAKIAEVRAAGCTKCMIQGEMCFVVAFVSRAEAMGIECYAACSDRSSSEVVQADGSTRKVATFTFVQFRRY